MLEIIIRRINDKRVNHQNTYKKLFLLPVQDIVPTGIMEEINELFVAENKLNAAVAEANTLPTISITKVPSLGHCEPSSLKKFKYGRMQE